MQFLFKAQKTLDKFKLERLIQFRDINSFTWESITRFGFLGLLCKLTENILLAKPVLKFDFLSTRKTHKFKFEIIDYTTRP